MGLLSVCKKLIKGIKELILPGEIETKKPEQKKPEVILTASAERYNEALLDLVERTRRAARKVERCRTNNWRKMHGIPMRRKLKGKRRLAKDGGGRTHERETEVRRNI